MRLKIAKVLSQKDSRWSSKLLGLNKNTYTIGSDGCLITSITLYLNSLGIEITPDQLNSLGVKNNCFVNGGYWVWSNLGKIYPEIALYHVSTRYWGMDTPESFFESLRSFLDRGYVPLIEVDSNPSQVGEQMHWVMGYGYEGDDFLIADPWTGDLCKLSKFGRLKDITVSFRIYSRTLPLDKPDTGELDKLKDENKDLKDKVTKLENSLSTNITPLNTKKDGKYVYGIVTDLLPEISRRILGGDTK